MEKELVVFSFNGAHGGGIRASIIPQEKRDPKVDAIKLYYRSSEEAKNKKDWHTLELTPTEALAISVGLTLATGRHLSDEKKID